MRQRGTVCTVFVLLALATCVRWACPAACAGLYSSCSVRAVRMGFSAAMTVSGAYPQQMPVCRTDSGSFIGVLDIPALRLELPVQEKWSEARLQTAPCRYAGTAYEKGFVVAAYNYKRHFGKIETLRTGERVNFTDANGRVLCYTVCAVEVLAPQAVGSAADAQWDLTLLACAEDGGNRVAVRCEKR